MKHLARTAIATALLLLATVSVAHEGEAGGISVESVVPDSPAAAAGLQDGDRFVRLDGQEIKTVDDLRNVMAEHRPGDVVSLIVQREGETVELSLKFGATPDGGVSIGVELAVTLDPGEAAEGTTQCLAWLEETYSISSVMQELDLDLTELYEETLECVARDTQRMGKENAVRYCDNVFKGHCPGLDLLTEIGEAQVDRCEELIGESLGLNLDQHKGWKACAQHKVFDRYSFSGDTSDEAACRAALLDECGTNIDETVKADTISPEQRGFVECCSADALDPDSSDRCAMIDEGFQRGPCHDQPVCVNRLTSEWLHCSAPGDQASAASWSQWGGPNRDFRAPAGDLATSWPESGPEELWSRSLGGGYSAVLADHDRLYTMYRTGNQEAVICLDAGTGETVWEYLYEHGPREGHVGGFGKGPNATPLIAGDLVFTVGIAGKMNALNKSDGKVVWSRDLWGEDFGGNFLTFGYSSSPVAYKDVVIVPVGGENASLVAFRQDDGSVKWKAHSFRNSYSSPSIMELAGEQQLVAFMAEELVGINPETGDLRWRYPHANQWRHNIMVPMVADGDTILVSSAQIGARGLHLTLDGETIRVEEAWSERRVQFYHGSPVRNGEWVYGTSGTATPAFMSAINIRTGEIAWRERGFAKANCVEADGKLVILDEDGMLYLASATPEKLVVHARTQLFDGVSWTVPTIVGNTLYARDNNRIVAVNLG